MVILLYSSPSIIYMIWGRHVARMGKRGMHIGFWWENQKIPIGRPSRRWEDNIKIDFKEIGWVLLTGLIWLRIGTSEGLL
jgi:hypothetical protein